MTVEGKALAASVALATAATALREAITARLLFRPPGGVEKGKKKVESFMGGSLDSHSLPMPFLYSLLYLKNVLFIIIVLIYDYLFKK